jgi:hypothetical protein
VALPAGEAAGPLGVGEYDDAGNGEEEDKDEKLDDEGGAAEWPDEGVAPPTRRSAPSVACTWAGGGTGGDAAEA